MIKAKAPNSDVEVFTMAAFPIRGHTFDFVGIPEEPANAAPAAPPAAATREMDMDSDPIFLQAILEVVQLLTLLFLNSQRNLAATI